MSDPVEHVIYKIRNAAIQNYPFPHFFVRDVFPSDFYWDMLASLPSDDDYHPFVAGYDARGTTDVKLPMAEQFDTQRFGMEVMQAFAGAFFERYPNRGRPNFTQEFRFIRDSEGYSIGPHTDARRKVVSLFFYLPATNLDSRYGTGLYVPDDLQRKCVGGPHYPFEGFKEVWRAPFLPNSCLGFFKTDHSWHAVEKICSKIRRDVLLFNIYEEKHVKPLIQTLT